MCFVSAVGDTWGRTVPQMPYYNPIVYGGEVSRAEFEQLKRDMQELKELLKAAKRYDDATGQRDCEMEEKIALVRKFAEVAGVNLDDLFTKPTSS